MRLSLLMDCVLGWCRSGSFVGRRRAATLVLGMAMLQTGALGQKVAPVRREGSPVLNIRVGVELSFDYLQACCDGDAAKGRAHIVDLMREFNQWTVAELQLHLDLRESIVPLAAGEDPTLGSTDKQLVMDSISKRFRSPGRPEEDLFKRFDLLIKICPSSRIGGGLSYCPPGSGNFAFFVAGFGGTDGWPVMRHEFAHTLDQWHEYGFPYEHGVMGGRGIPTNPFAPAPAPTGHYSRRETEGMTRCAKEVRLFRTVDKSSGLVDAKGLWKADVPPKALLDFVRPRRGKDGRFEPVVVDAARNDRSANYGALVVEPEDGGRSFRGGKVEPKGKGQLLYTPPEGAAPDASTWDHFRYKLTHSNGLADVGEVLVIYDLDDDLLVDGGFEGLAQGDVERAKIDADGKLAGKGSKWRFHSARPALRAPRPYPRPWRGWYRTDLADLVGQSDDARWVQALPPEDARAGRVVVLRQELGARTRVLKPGREYRVTWECLDGRPQEMHAALAWPGGERCEFRLLRHDLGDQGPSSVHDGRCRLPDPLPPGEPTLEIAASWAPNAAPIHLDNVTLHLECAWPSPDQAEAPDGR